MRMCDGAGSIRGLSQRKIDENAACAFDCGGLKLPIGDLHIYKLQATDGLGTPCAGLYGRWVALLSVDPSGSIRLFRVPWPTFDIKGVQGNAYLQRQLWKRSLAQYQTSFDSRYYLPILSIQPNPIPDEFITGVANPSNPPQGFPAHTLALNVLSRSCRCHSPFFRG